MHFGTKINDLLPISRIFSHHLFGKNEEILTISIFTCFNSTTKDSQFSFGWIFRILISVWLNCVKQAMQFPTFSVSFNLELRTWRWTHLNSTTEYIWIRVLFIRKRPIVIALLHFLKIINKLTNSIIIIIKSKLKFRVVLSNIWTFYLLQGTCIVHCHQGKDIFPLTFSEQLVISDPFSGLS